VLQLEIPLSESYDEEKEEFVVAESATVCLEHSLVSLSKWESKYEKPFLGTQEKTTEETLDYVRMMIVGPELPPEIFAKLIQEFLEPVYKYIDAKMSATWFSEHGQKPNREIITAEVIYYWMFSYGIPIEFESRHLNQLIALIRVFQAKNAPEQKMSAAEQARMQRDINNQRKKELGTRG
jgi:hypothetical protein